MAGASLLALIDDIAVILDDVSVMTKVAAKKTAGVLADDLALNANQVQGVKASRELPVVWAVAKGSFVNKLILVPLALILSAIAQKTGLNWLITAPLILGGLYLCFEGAEKVLHKFWPHHSEGHDEFDDHVQANINDVDLVAFEKEKIKGAIRTDFILSAEIIVIALGSAASATLMTQSLVLSAIAIAMTVGVYGLVAGIVKLDDVGLWLHNKPSAAAKKVGSALLGFAPLLMKFLSIAGTAAMFLVGGGILVHGFDILHHKVAHLAELTGMFSSVSAALLNGAIGLAAGLVIVALFTVFNKVRGKAH